VETGSANDAGEILAFLSETLTRYGVTRFALTGGIAFSCWVSPRFTKDFDLCAVVSKDAADRLVARFDGVSTGPFELPHTLRLSIGSWDVDVFVAHTDYDENCLARAVETEIAGHRIRVVTPEDLIVHKLIKLRDDKSKLLLDASDLRELLGLPSMNLDYVRQWARPAEYQVVAEAKTLSPSAFVQRLEAL
jgi:hypothetical protein